MVAAGDKVLVGVSGGPDSICLLNVLEDLRSRYSLTILVAHFNHKLRGAASERDAQFVEQVALGKGLAFMEGSGDVGAYAKAAKLSIEAAGRELRYDFFVRSSLSAGADKVAVGHSADDQAETILMRLLRGAGPEGLAGIPPVRLLGKSTGRPTLIRPLLNAWRSDIMHYVRTRKLKYRKDVSNESLEYLRNKIRLELIPHLKKEYNPKIRQRLANAASALAIENDFMETESGLLASEMIIERKPGWLVFDVRLLATLHPSLRKRIVSALVSLADARASMLEAVHFDDADALLCSDSGRLDLPGGLRFEISEGRGLISRTAQQPQISTKAFNVSIDGTTSIPVLDIVVKTKVMGCISSPPHLVRLCNPNRQYFNLDEVRPPIEIRLRRPGDSFSPLGASGSKKLKDFFIDKKVPRFLRDRVPLLISNGRIMWIMGYAIDRKFRLKSDTGSAFRVDYER